MEIVLAILSLGGLGFVFGLLLSFSSKKFEVAVDPKVQGIKDSLPGVNCAACGYVGCASFAEAVAAGKAPANGCIVGGAAVAEKIADVLGVDANAAEKTVAFVKCGGNCKVSKDNYEYTGVEDCTAVSYLAGQGSKACTYGCMGYGSCKKVCPFDAIDMVDGIAVIDKSKCTSCGKCVKSCPKKLIEIVPFKSEVKVNCNSKDKGKDVKLKCGVGCIACKLCEKACKFDAIHVENNISHVDYSKCTLCMECVKKCPTKCITGQVKD